MPDESKLYIVHLETGGRLPPARIIDETQRQVVVDCGTGYITIRRELIASIEEIDQGADKEGDKKPSAPPQAPATSVQNPAVREPTQAPVADNSRGPIGQPERATQSTPAELHNQAADGPNDRLQIDSTQFSDEDPRIYIFADGGKFPRPGLETFFADAVPSNCACDPVAQTYCVCNKVAVCTCVSVCSCVQHVSCSCEGHDRGGGTRVTGCRCAPVH